MRYCLALCLCLAIVGLTSAGGGANKTGKQRADNIAPYLDSQTFAVFYADLSTLQVGKVIQSLAADLPLPQQEMQMAQAKMEQELAKIRKAGIREAYAVVNLADIPFDPIYLVIPVARGKGEAVVKFLSENAQGKKVKQVGQIVYVGSSRTEQHFRNDPPTGLIEAFSAASDADAQAVLVLSDLLRKSSVEAAPRLPKELGNEPLAPYVRSFQWASAGLYLQPKVSAKLKVKTTDAESAKALHSLAGRILNLAKKEMAKELPGVQFPDFLMPKQEKDQLTLSVKQEQFVGPAMQAIAKMRAAAARMQSMNNLKQIGLAMHNYHDVYRTFPPAANVKNGKPLLSWRVHVLPFLEQQKLYKQFKLDEPWDSPHNKKLIAKMPPVYRATHSKAAPGKTVYLVPVGKKMAFVPGSKGQKISEFRDGTSNTILAVDVDDAKAVIWTKPDDLTVNPKSPLDGLGKDRGMFNALFADGSVQVISRDVNAEVLYGLFTRNGGEVNGLNN